MTRKKRQDEDVIQVAEGKGHSFNDFFKRAVNPMLVLRLLSEQPMYVYQMTQELKTRGESASAASFLYPVIYRLQKLGYIEESGREISADNRLRNFYAITDAGRAYLKTLVTEYQEMLDIVDHVMTGYDKEQ